MRRRSAFLVATGLGGAAALAGARRLRRPGATGIGDARVLGPDKEAAVLRRLAAWTPAPPRTPTGRLAGYLWAAPVTAAGALVGLTTGVLPHRRDGVLVFAPARGPAGAVLRSRGFTATAWGHVVVALHEPDPGLLAHELVHVRHAERLGVFSAPLYLALLAVRGYARHPMEQAARLGARRFRGAPA